VITWTVVAVVALALAVWAYRANEIFCVSVRKGQVLVVRGRVPGTLLADIRMIVARPIVARATIRAVKAESGARIVTSGIDEGQTQRLRNTFSVYPMARLRAAPPIERKTVGQILGIAWLAWIFERSSR
jgi:hypothetical protein